MAAGLGFKTFTTGEVLTAADVNGYLMQGVLVFASSAARAAAITSPQEGQYSYLKDTNALEYYDGAAWVGAPVGDITAVTAGKGLTGGGSSGDVTVSLATTAKGDLVAGSGTTTAAVLAVGANNTVLTADSTTATGLKWATPSSTPSFVGCSLTKSVSQSIASGTETAVTFDVEAFDTDGFHSTSTNTNRITIPSGKAGKYLVMATICVDSSGNQTQGGLRKNGTNIGLWYASTTGAALMVTQNNIFDLAVGDYLDVFAWQGSGVSKNILANNYTQSITIFSVQYLGA